MDLQITGPVQFFVRHSVYFGEERVAECKEDKHETDCSSQEFPAGERTLPYDKSIPKHCILQKHYIT